MKIVSRLLFAGLVLGVMVTLNGFAADAPGADKATAPAKADTGTVVIGNGAKVKKAEETLPAIVAKVGEETITGKEFGRQIDFYQKRAEAQVGSSIELDDAQRYEFLQYAVDERVLEIMAKADKVAASDEEVKAEYDKALQQAGSPEEFNKHLAQYGFSEEDAKSLMRSNLTKSKWVELKTKDLKVTDEELKAKYDELKGAGQLDQPESYNVSHILIKVDEKDRNDEAAWTKAKEGIDAALKRVKGGEAFAAVAKAVSQDPGSADRGGSYPGVQAGQMVPEFEKVMMATPVGQVSEPFRTAYGWHFLKVDAKNAPKTLDLATIKEELSQDLLGKKKDEEVQKLVAAAKAKMKIEVMLPQPKPEAPAQAPAAPAAKTEPAAKAEPAATPPAAAPPAAAK